MRGTTLLLLLAAAAGIAYLAMRDSADKPRVMVLDTRALKGFAA